MSEHNQKLDAVFRTGMADTGNGRRSLGAGQIIDFVMNVLGFVIDQSPDELFSSENALFRWYAIGIDVANAMGLIGFILFRLASGGFAGLFLFSFWFFFGFIALGTVIETELRFFGSFGFGVLLEGRL
jgi:hypothetical protein